MYSKEYGRVPDFENNIRLITQLNIIISSINFMSRFFVTFFERIHFLYFLTDYNLWNLNLMNLSDTVNTIEEYLNPITTFRDSIFMEFELSRRNHIFLALDIPYHIFLDLSKISNPLRVSYLYALDEVLQPIFNITNNFDS